ncbi:2Fe-2S iron-sulfur cluster-binding protein [Sphingomonas sp. Tas61C01]|uniref:2Fe-2S iron-sulfur cluster-binding protein n=1 Tax=Sphingomonas sp. Tas61C01 TaxID=3458297 RepID=UPI00403E6686
MIALRFIARDGTVHDSHAVEGTTLLAAAQAADQPLEGTCDGDMACATCHVLIDPEDFDRLPRASAAEEDMLDLAYATTRTSRLACQITLTAALDGLTVRMPPGH